MMINEWQPIETAPKDGTEFQAWVVPKYLPVSAGSWETRARFHPDTEQFEVWGRIDYDIDGWDFYYNLTPTHWSPHPASPE